VKNVYTGNYAYGKSGTATNTNTGASVKGGKVTVGNAYTGSSATVGAISGSTPGGPTRSAVGVKGDNGGVIAVGGPGDKQVYGTKDGEVYKRSDSGQWEQVGGNKPTPYSSGNRPDLPSQGSNLSNRPATPSQLPGGGSTIPQGNYQDLNRQQQARDLGNQRANSFQQSRPSGGFQGGGGYRGGGGGRRR